MIEQKIEKTVEKLKTLNSSKTFRVDPTSEWIDIRMGTGDHLDDLYYLMTYYFDEGYMTVFHIGIEIIGLTETLEELEIPYEFY